SSGGKGCLKALSGPDAKDPRRPSSARSCRSGILEESLWQAGLAIAFHKPVSCGQIAKGLSFGPIANSEVGISREIESTFLARFLQPAKLRQGRGEEAPGPGAICRLVAQSLDRRLILAGGVLSLPEPP